MAVVHPKINQMQKYIMEFYQCKKSFDYFCRNYIYIEMPGQDVLLKPYKPQQKLIDTINKDKNVLVLKSRQIGISTIIQAYTCWLVTFYKNTVVGIISKDGKEATDFARTTRGMFEKLPLWMKPQNGIQGPGFAKRTEQSFILTNGSKVYASPVNPNAPEKTLRGKAITFLIIDEAAFIGKLDDAWTSMVPALSTNQMHAKRNNVPYGTIVLSTPNKTVGVGKWFFERYTRAINGEGLMTPFIIHWKDVDELSNDPDWYNTQCELFDNDPKKIQQELELKFLGSTGCFFEEDTIEKLQEISIDPIEKLKIFNGEIWKFQEPIPDNFYIIGVDTAPEHGSDKSAISVFDYKTMEQVWEYQGKCKVLDFVKVVKVACAQYPGLCVIENNSYGNQVCEHMNASEFSSMLYKEKKGQNSFQVGLSTNIKTRPLMIDALYSYITQYTEIIKSQRLSLELVGLIEKPNGKIEADTGCHDDISMATACCMYVRKYDPPLLIDTKVSNLVQQEFTKIIDFNDDVSLTEFSNAKVMKYVKKNLDGDRLNRDEQGVINILGLYGME